MRNRKQISAVLVVAVILGIVGCKNQSNTKIGKDDIEITTTVSVETQKETTESKELSTTNALAPTSMEESSETSAPESTESSALETNAPPETENQDPIKVTEKEPTPTAMPQATVTPTATPQPTATPEPTSSPTPTNTPVPTNTPSPEPTPFDIDKSAKENGYEIIEVDMGSGKTEKVYGYYVDMSGLDDKVNDYRESIGMSRLPKDTNHISEMKIRVVEISLPGHFSHHRPNGKGGTESNIVGGTNVDECYNDLYNSPGHRAAWEDPYATTIYSIGFRRMEYDESKGEWVGAGRYTVQYLDYNL